MYCFSLGMARSFFLVTLFILTGNFSLAQAISEDEGTDLSRYQVVGETETQVTLQDLDRREGPIREMIASANCAEALPLIVEFAEDANVLANIIRQSLEPFYSARNDDQESISRGDPGFQSLVNAERTSNGLLRLRNEFWVIEAKCLIEQNQSSAAVNRLFRALDFIDGIQERQLWLEARELLWEQVGYGG